MPCSPCLLITLLSDALLSPVESPVRRHATPCGDQTSASLLSRALNALTCRMGRYIKFPSTQEALTDTRHGFYAVVGFLRVIGAVDCSGVQNVSPSNTEHGYLLYTLIKPARLITNSRFSVLGKGECGDGWRLAEYFLYSLRSKIQFSDWFKSKHAYFPEVGVHIPCIPSSWLRFSTDLSGREST